MIQRLCLWMYIFRELNIVDTDFRSAAFFLVSWKQDNHT